MSRILQIAGIDPNAKNAPKAHQAGTAEKLANWLPAIGGVAGSFIPGAGTIVGGALGAAGGALLKDYIMNHDADQENNVSGTGYLADAAKEGALGLAGGVVGKGAGIVGGKLLGSGANAVSKLLGTGASEFGDDAAIAAGKAVAGKAGSLADISAQAAAKAGTVERGASQPLIEKALNAGRPNEAWKIVEKLSDRDPNKASMISLLETMGHPRPVSKVPFLGTDRVSQTLDKTGNALRKSVTNPQVKVGPTMFQDAEALAAKAQQMGLKGSRGAQAKQAGEIYNQLGEQIKTVAEQNKTPVNFGKVYTNIREAIRTNPSVLGDKGAVKDAEELILQQVDKASGGQVNGSVSQIADLKTMLAKNAQKLFDKAQKGPLTQGEEAYLTAWKAVDNEIAKVAPELKALTMQQSTLHDLATGLSKTDGFRIPGIGVRVPIANRALEATADLTGRGLKAFAMEPGTALGKAGAAAVGQTMVRPGTNAPMAQADSGIDPTMDLNMDPSQVDQNASSQGVAPEGQEISPYSPAYYSKENQARLQSQQAPDPSAGSSFGGITKEQIGQAMIEDLKHGGNNIAALSTIAKFLIPAEAAAPKLTDTAIKQSNDYQSAIQNIDALGTTLKSTKVSVGPIAGRLSGLNPFDTDAQSLQSQIDVVRQTVGKALEGGVLRKEDEDKYKKILPTMADTAPVAQNKIEQLKVMLTRDYQRYASLQNSKGGGSFNLDNASVTQE